MAPQVVMGPPRGCISLTDFAISAKLHFLSVGPLAAVSLRYFGGRQGEAGGPCMTKERGRD